MHVVSCARSPSKFTQFGRQTAPNRPKSSQNRSREEPGGLRWLQVRPKSAKKPPKSVPEAPREPPETAPGVTVPRGLPKGASEGQEGRPREPKGTPGQPR